MPATMQYIFVCSSRSVSVQRSHILIRWKFGEEQYEAYKNRQPLPALVRIHANDSDHIRTVKRLIVDMTSYYASQRPSSADVRRRLGRPEIAPPKKVTTRKADISRKPASASAGYTHVIFTSFRFKFTKLYQSVSAEKNTNNTKGTSQNTSGASSSKSQPNGKAKSEPQTNVCTFCHL